jgi:hypothetical protein
MTNGGYPSKIEEDNGVRYILICLIPSEGEKQRSGQLVGRMNANKWNVWLQVTAKCCIVLEE